MIVAFSDRRCSAGISIAHGLRFLHVIQKYYVFVFANDYHALSIVHIFFILQTYNYSFQARDNGKSFDCVAYLKDFPGNNLTVAHQLNVLRKWRYTLIAILYFMEGQRESYGSCPLSILANGESSGADECLISHNIWNKIL